MLGFIIKSVAYLPLWFWYRVSDILFLIVFYGAGYRKKVVLDNLKKVFPDYTQAQRKQIAKDFYSDFCDFLVEVIKSFRISKKDLLKRVRPSEETLRIIQSIEKNQQSIIVLATHHMSWEWVNTACSAEFDLLVAPVYKPLSNKKIDTLIYNMRSRFGAKPIPMKEAGKAFSKKDKRATAFVLVGDQTPAGHNRQYWTTFFGQEVPFFVGVAHLAPQSNLPIYFIRIWKEKRGYYQYALEPLCQPPYQQPIDYAIIDLYSQKIEDAVRSSPRNWLWTHRRWKRVKEKNTTLS